MKRTKSKKTTVTMRDREAYHEAGHVVVRLLMGLPFVAASIERKTKTGFQLENGRKIPMQYFYTDGISWTDDYTKTSNAEILAGKLDIREALSSMAGPSAEARLVGRVDATAQQGAQTDVQQILVPCRAALSWGEPMERWAPTKIEGAILRAVGDECLRLVEANWPKVEAVAAALLERDRLTRAEAAQIVTGGRLTTSKKSSKQRAMKQTATLL